MNLITLYFKADKLERQAEYLTCLHENVMLFTKIAVLISDDNSPLFISAKNMMLVLIDTVPTFKDFFEFCNKTYPDQICVVANGDIRFDTTIAKMEGADYDNVFYALSRWEDGKPLKSAVSQDVWIFKTPVRVRDDMNFGLGSPGNDNRLARIMHELGYEVRNPALVVKTHHFHKSKVRPKLEKIKGPYMSIMPSDIDSEGEYALMDRL